METRNCTDRLPFFEVFHHPVDDRFGRIKVCNEQLGAIGFLDYFHGFSDEMLEKTYDKQAFIVTKLSLSKGVMSDTLERGLLYIAACIADNAGEEVMYCRPQETAPEEASDLWEILGVRKLLDNYDSLVQQV